MLGKRGRARAGNECIAVREGFKRARVSQGNYRYLYCSKGGICVGNGGVIENEAKLSRARSRARELEFQHFIQENGLQLFWCYIVLLLIKGDMADRVSSLNGLAFKTCPR
jgi:hypothetical protein